MDNVIPDYAVPFSEAYGGPQFIARALLEVRPFFHASYVTLMFVLSET